VKSKKWRSSVGDENRIVGRGRRRSPWGVSEACAEVESIDLLNGTMLSQNISSAGKYGNGGGGGGERAKSEKKGGGGKEEGRHTRYYIDPEIQREFWEVLSLMGSKHACGGKS